MKTLDKQVELIKVLESPDLSHDERKAFKKQLGDLLQTELDERRALEVVEAIGIKKAILSNT